MRSLRTCLACLLAASMVFWAVAEELPPDWWLITDEDPFFALQQELGDSIPDALKGGPVAAGAAASSGGSSAAAGPGGATASSGGSSAAAGPGGATASSGGSSAAAGPGGAAASSGGSSAAAGFPSAGSASSAASAGSSSAAAEAAKAPLPAPAPPPRFPERPAPQEESAAMGGFGGGPGAGAGGDAPVPGGPGRPGGAAKQPAGQGAPLRPPARQPGGGPIIFPTDKPKTAGAEIFSQNTVFGGECTCAHPTSCTGQPGAPQGMCARGQVCCPPEHRYRPKCGRMALEPRSAQSVRDSEAPWMAALLEKVPNGYIFVCGGSLIHEQVVLTAARCVQRFQMKKDSLVVRLGEMDILSNRERFAPVEIAVKDIAIHANYSVEQKYNDLALLFLRDPAPLRPGLDTVCVRRQAADSADCSIHSYGLRQTGSPAFDLRLRAADQAAVPFRECQRLLRGAQGDPRFNLHPSFRCTTSDVTCDLGEDRAGSPLTCSIPRRREHQLMGVVSWGVGCQRQQKPGVYTSVADFYGWIEYQVTGYFGYIESAFGPLNQV